MCGDVIDITMRDKMSCFSQVLESINLYMLPMMLLINDINISRKSILISIRNHRMQSFVFKRKHEVKGGQTSIKKFHQTFFSTDAFPNRKLFAI